MAEHAALAGQERDPQHADGPVVAPADPSHRAVTEGAGAVRPRHRRRVTTDAPPGSDPAPEPEPGRHSSAENDEQLKRDKPPHWG